ncbi:uncharacterized protein LOC124841479 isoform X2 [Vigna umbellata]|uniref:uncharacterized protein LOC124841479 isoform X2 n=1 Tax=Vigna umbellata TaxID=87088 RepID=UPI001F5E3FBC|nr:uncharacterized protein LOC124841479 isoform X2 [Vigna umbellata]
MVGPKRHFLPLILISLAAFIFYTFNHFSLSPAIAESNHRSTFPDPIPTLIHPNFSFVINVLAFNRLASLSRCLRSLAAADYLGDRIHLHLHIDHFTSDKASSVDPKLREARRILEFVDAFDWKFGEKVVHYRTGNVGLQAQWLEAWWPTSDHEFAFVVEDDLEVSSLYYEFVKTVILNFYYNASNYSPSIFGISLQRARFVPGKHGNKLQLDDKTRLFLYQLVGTWGQILFPKPWKEFRLWYEENKAKGNRPFLEGMFSSLHYRQKRDSVLVNLFGVSDAIARNLLCHFERLNIRNYILVGPPSDSLFDLARRGHHVINVDQFLSSVGLYKHTWQGSNSDSIKSILAKIYVIKKCIENKYNTWVMDGNMLLTSDLFSESENPNDDFFVANNFELFYAKSSSSSEKIWVDGFVSKIVAEVKSLAGKDSEAHYRLSFVHIVTKLLEQKGARIRRVDESSLATKIGSGNVSESFGDKKLLYWSTEIELDSISKWFKELNLWNIDNDLSCTAVVCHKS